MSRGVLNKEELGVLMMNDPLPNTLSELIMVAVTDARKLDRDLYSPCSRLFHFFTTQRWCLVCDAGAVMAGTLGRDRQEDSCPSQYSRSVEAKLNALDAARQGHYYAALRIIGLSGSGIDEEALESIGDSPHQSYKTWEEFDKHLNHMEGVARQLEALGY